MKNKTCSVLDWIIYLNAYNSQPVPASLLLEGVTVILEAVTLAVPLSRAAGSQVKYYTVYRTE